MKLQRPWHGTLVLVEDLRAAIQGEGLGSQMLRGGAWTLGLRIATQVVSMIQVVFVARLLAPHDFGLMGVAMLAVGIVDLFTEPGLVKAVTQRRGDVLPYLNTVFTVQLARGIITAIGLLLLAPTIANFFDRPGAEDVVRAMAAFVVVRGLANPAMVLFTREMSFRQGSVVALVGLIVALIVTVPLAYVLRSVWALLLGMIASQASMTVASYVVSSYRPRLEFDRQKLRELTRFGRWITASNISYYALLNGDSILVGKFLGTAPLGLYQFAYRLSNLPATEITRTLAQVCFPAYASIQHDRARLRETYLQVLRATTLLSLPAATALLVVAPDLIAGVMGSQWLPALQAFQVLCAYAASRSVIATTGPLFQGAGWPSVPPLLAVGQLVVLAVVAYPAMQKWDLVGIAAAVAIANTLALAVAMVLAGRLVEARLSGLAVMLWPGIRAAAILGAALLPIRLFVEASPYVRLGAELGIMMLLSPVVLLPLMRSFRRTGGQVSRRPALQQA
ncbi:MAG TPA: lipopolysaccharide biosynthesis protein [Thermomicrobiales bacterium]